MTGSLNMESIRAREPELSASYPDDDSFLQSAYARHYATKIPWTEFISQMQARFPASRLTATGIAHENPLALVAALSKGFQENANRDAFDVATGIPRLVGDVAMSLDPRAPAGVNQDTGQILLDALKGLGHRAGSYFHSRDVPIIPSVESAAPGRSPTIRLPGLLANAYETPAGTAADLGLAYGGGRYLAERGALPNPGEAIQGAAEYGGALRELVRARRLAQAMRGPKDPLEELAGSRRTVPGIRGTQEPLPESPIGSGRAEAATATLEASPAAEGPSTEPTAPGARTVPRGTSDPATWGRSVSTGWLGKWGGREKMAGEEGQLRRQAFEVWMDRVHRKVPPDLSRTEKSVLARFSSRGPIESPDVPFWDPGSPFKGLKVGERKALLRLIGKGRVDVRGVGAETGGRYTNLVFIPKGYEKWSIRSPEYAGVKADRSDITPPVAGGKVEPPAPPLEAAPAEPAPPAPVAGPPPIPKPVKGYPVSAKQWARFNGFLSDLGMTADEFYSVLGEKFKVRSPEEFNAKNIQDVNRGLWKFAAQGIDPRAQLELGTAVRGKKVTTTPIPKTEQQQLREETDAANREKIAREGTTSEAQSGDVSTATPLDRKPNEEYPHPINVQTPAGLVSVGVRYEWVPLSELKPSHLTSWEPNPAFPKHLAKRAYHSDLESRGKVLEMVTKTNVDELASISPHPTSGPPTVNPYNQVLAGNGRTIGLNMLREHGKLGPVQEAMTREAERIGIGGPPAGMKDPVLVRRLPELSLEEEASISKWLDEPPTEARSWLVEAVAASRAISPRVLDLADSLMGQGTLRDALGRADSGELVRNLMDDGVIPVRQKAKYIDDSGLLNAHGIEFVEAALVAKLLEDPGLISAMGPGVRGMVAKGLPELLIAKQAGAEFDLMPYVVEGVRINLFRDSVKKVQGNMPTVKALLDQRSMFTEDMPTFTPEGRRMAEILDELSAGAFRSRLKEYVRGIRPEQRRMAGSLLGDEAYDEKFAPRFARAFGKEGDSMKAMKPETSKPVIVVPEAVKPKGRPRSKTKGKKPPTPGESLLGGD